MLFCSTRKRTVHQLHSDAILIITGVATHSLTTGTDMTTMQ